jgi:hypothetical protein
MRRIQLKYRQHYLGLRHRIFQRKTSHGVGVNPQEMMLKKWRRHNFFLAIFRFMPDIAQ